MIVRQQDTAHDGDIVAALIEDEATLKTFHRANGHVWLMPQNSRHKPILGDQCGADGQSSSHGPPDVTQTPLAYIAT